MRSKKRRAVFAQASPTVAQLEEELRRETYRKRFRQVLFSTVCTLITVSAAAVLIATLFLPVLRIYGASMSPTLSDGDIVVTVAKSNYERGDLIAFWYNNKILVKRVIALGGEQLDMDETGTVFIDGVPLEEPYLAEKSLGNCDIQLPYQVPAGRIFVMGDHRSTSTDSRSSALGCVSEEQIVGKLVLRVWPFQVFGALD